MPGLWPLGRAQFQGATGGSLVPVRGGHKSIPHLHETNGGGYMQAKLRKLQAQTSPSEARISSIFAGVRIYVNGYTVPSADIIHRLVQQHGGSFTNYFSKSAGDFMIASNLAESKVKNITDHKIVKPAWITASIQSGKLLPWRNFELYPTGTRGSKQRSLRKMTKKTEPTLSVIEPTVACSSMTSTHSGPGNYLANFYARSRLHHLSTWASDLRDLVRNLPESEKRLGWEATTIRLKPSTPSASRLRPPILMHIDMDCFFVSVCLRSRPDLKGTLIFSAAGSFSEVASCSYEARKFGIKNGMHLGDARKLCPELKTVPYDFEAFHSVSEQLYKIVACLNIEAVSCDEMYVDLSDLLSPVAEPGRIINPFLLGSELRRRVFEATGCTATCGFGTNRLLTRLATVKAKPNNQAFLIGASTHSAGAGNKLTPDSSDLMLDRFAKSVSAEINYGVRLASVGFFCYLSFWFLPSSTLRQTGHGICDTWTRTVQLPTPTRDVSFLTSQCMSVLRRINPDPTDIRGVSLRLLKRSMSA
ncbi:unnamed protein product [Schistocephalus solidus]|uniref:DNA repair protein REV1 n=1 Tax=Schistocephalus solidus TaxID=70667 RepID=A0A3P7CXX3_SCHSO|nr:unnamed protein product [Schistocephalus solidus]